MAQGLNFDKFIDVDNTVVKPSPHRVRNTLTLEEKIAVIKAYEQRPMYKKVARMFNCSWEQIKNIVTNRVAIMEFYEATKNKNKHEADNEDDFDMDLRQKKLKFLGECVYECIQRLQYHAKLPITEELIRHKALEFLEVLRLPGFVPTKKWMHSFKTTYDITLSTRQISIRTEPQSSLDIKDIMTYCTKPKTHNYLLSKLRKTDVRMTDGDARRVRKLSFLQDALKEYLLRVKFHHKSMKLNAAALMQVARDLTKILKIQEFEPSEDWIEKFTNQYNSKDCLANSKVPPLSLDLKDILSYCGRMPNKTRVNNVTLKPKETALQMRVIPKFPGHNKSDSGLIFQNKPIIYLDEEAGAKDMKPDMAELRAAKANFEQPPPLKIRKIESINNDPELQRKVSDGIDMRIPPLVAIRQMSREPPKEQSKHPPKTIVYIQKMISIPDKKNNPCLASPPANVTIKEETFEDNGYILPTNPSELKTEEVQPPATPCRLASAQHYSLPKTPSHTIEDNENVELPRHVTSFKDVLLLLKPLEEYAMLKENYRAIGLITQLEEVLKKEPQPNNGDDEFIG